MFGMEAQAMNETHAACKTGLLLCKQTMLRPRGTIVIHPVLPYFTPLRTSPPPLKAKIKNNAVLEDGDEQHDAKPGQQAQVLEDKVSKLAALVVLAVAVKHFWQLQKTQRNQQVGSRT